MTTSKRLSAETLNPEPLNPFTAYADAWSTSPRNTPRYPVHSALEEIAAGAGETSVRC